MPPGGRGGGGITATEKRIKVLTLSETTRISQEEEERIFPIATKKRDQSIGKKEGGFKERSKTVAPLRRERGGGRVFRSKKKRGRIANHLEGRKRRSWWI